MVYKPSLEEFKKEFWEKLSQKHKKFIFYVSLYDAQSFEEIEPGRSLLNKIKKLKERVKKILKKKNKEGYLKYFKEDKSFDRFIDGDLLCRYILLLELEKHNIKTDEKRSLSPGFPDIKLKGNKGTIEVKRFFSGGNICKEIKKTIKRINKGMRGRYILLILIPLAPILNLRIIHDKIHIWVIKLSDMLYFIKDWIIEGVKDKKKKIDVIIKSVDSKGINWDFEAISQEIEKVKEREKRKI